MAAFEAGDHAASLQALAALKEPVDAFFDEVMVNADDPAQRANRLGLLVDAARGDEPQRRSVEAAPERLPARTPGRSHETHHLRPRRHAEPRPRRLCHDGRRMAADPRRAGSGRGADAGRLACGGRDQPVGSRPRPVRHGDAQCDAPEAEPGAGRSSAGASMRSFSVRMCRATNATAASRCRACCCRSASAMRST